MSGIQCTAETVGRNGRLSGSTSFLLKNKMNILCILHTDKELSFDEGGSLFLCKTRRLFVLK